MTHWRVMRVRVLFFALSPISNKNNIYRVAILENPTFFSITLSRRHRKLTQGHSSELAFFNLMYSFNLNDLII